MDSTGRQNMQEQDMKVESIFDGKNVGDDETCNR